MSSRFMDFDAAFAEDENAPEPIRLTLYGQEWQLPGVLPAIAPLKLARFRGAERPSREDFLEVAYAIAGRATVEAWLEHGITWDQLDQVLQWTMGEHAAASTPDDDDEDEDDESGEGQAPEDETSEDSSSNGGASSRRTSSASTASRSRKTSKG